MIESFLNRVLQHRIVIVLLILIATPMIAWKAFPPADNSMDIWLDREDPSTHRYDEFLDQFGSEEFYVVALHSEDLFSSSNLKKVINITELLKKITGIERVISITNIENIQSLADNTVEIKPFIGDDIPDNPVLLEQKRLLALKNPLYLNNLISKDGKTTAIYGFVEDQDFRQRRLIHDEIKSLVKKEISGTRIKCYISGDPVLDAEIDRMSQQDSKKFSIITTLLIVLILYILYRDFIGVLLPVVLVALSTLWTLGFYGWMGNKFNMVTITIPTVILAIAIADAIHFLCQYNDEIRLSPDNRRRPLQKTLLKIGPPCFFTSVTTAIGFGSFLSSRIAALRMHGSFTAMGILLAFAFNVILLPILLTWLKSSGLSSSPQHKGKFIDRSLSKVLYIVKKNPGTIIFISLLVFAFSMVGIVQLKTEYSYIDSFKKSSEVRKGMEFIENNITGFYPLEIMLTGPPESMKNPNVLQKIEDFRNYLATLPEVSKTLHVNDIVKEINVALHEGNSEYYLIPSEQNKTSQILLLYEISGEKGMEKYVNQDYSVSRISARTIAITAERATELIENMNNRLNAIFRDDDFDINVTGMLALCSQLGANILDSQIKSFSIAAFGIFVMMCVFFKSVPVGILSMIPNFLPIVVTLGVMGWLEIRLDTATIMIASVAIGISVDDTIHFMARFQSELKSSGDYDLAIQNTTKSVGQAIIYTSIILVGGFSSLTFGNLTPTIYFGFLTSITIIFALIGDLFLLPVLLKIFRPFKLTP